MAVAFGGTIPTVGATTLATLTSGSWAISGSNLVILVGFTYSSATITTSSVTWSLGGTGVLIKRIAGGPGGSTIAEIWAIPAPTAGTGTVTVTLSGAPPSWTFNADYFTGVDQTTPCPTADAVGDNNVNGSDTLTPANLTANDASWMCSGDANANIGSMAPNQTFIINSTGVDLGTGYALGTASVTANFTDSTNAHPNTAARIVAASAGPIAALVPYMRSPGSGFGMGF